MATFKNNVTEVRRLINEKGEYLILKILKEDGDIIEKKVFGPAVADFDQPGMYEVTNSKTKGGYWVIDSAVYLAQQPNGAKEAQEAPKTAHKAPERDASTNRAILLQVCVKAACEAYSGRPGTLEHALVLELAGKLLEWAEKNAQNRIEEVPF